MAPERWRLKSASVVIIILCAKLLPISPVVLGEFSEEQVEGFGVEKSLLDKELSHLFLSAALMQQ